MNASARIDVMGRGRPITIEKEAEAGSSVHFSLDELNRAGRSWHWQFGNWQQFLKLF
jgi:hypothetical protein